MDILTYAMMLLTIFTYLYFLIFALAEDNSGKYVAKSVAIPTLVLLIFLGVALTVAYLIKPSLANIIVWSPLGISLIVLLLSLLIWIPLSFWSIRRLTFPIFQSKYGLTKSDFRDFTGMNILNKKKKLEKWRDRNSLDPFDIKK